MTRQIHSRTLESWILGQETLKAFRVCLGALRGTRGGLGSRSSSVWWWRGAWLLWWKCIVWSRRHSSFWLSTGVCSRLLSLHRIFQHPYYVFGRGEIQRCLPACAASCSLGAGFQKREHQVRISYPGSFHQRRLMQDCIRSVDGSTRVQQELYNAHPKCLFGISRSSGSKDERRLAEQVRCVYSRSRRKQKSDKPAAIF